MSTFIKFCGITNEADALTAIGLGVDAIGVIFAHFDENGADLLLLDGPVPGSGEVFDWELAATGPDPERLIVSGGLDADNVAKAIELLRPFGVDVASGIEMAPGVKNPLAMKAFVDAVREVDDLVAQIDGQVDDDGDEPFDWMRD